MKVFRISALAVVLALSVAAAAEGRAARSFSNGSKKQADDVRHRRLKPTTAN